MLLSAFYLCQPSSWPSALSKKSHPLALGVWQLGFGGLFSGVAVFTFGSFTASQHAGEIVVVVALALHLLLPTALSPVTLV